MSPPNDPRSEVSPSEFTSQQPTVTIIGPDPVVPPVKPSEKPRKKMVLGLLVFIAVASVCLIVGATLWKINRNRSSPVVSKKIDRTNNNDSPETASEILANISGEWTKLNYKEGTPEIQDDPNLYVEVSNNNPVTLLVSADLYRLYVDYQDRKLRTPIERVLLKYGLNKDDKNEGYFRNKQVSCRITEKMYGIQVACATNERILKSTDRLETAIEVITEKEGPSYGPIEVRYEDSPDNKSDVMVFTANKSIGKIDLLGPIYLSSSDGKAWRYTGRLPENAQLGVDPKCNLFTKEELTLFKKIGVSCNQ